MRVAASLLPKHREIETNRHRSVGELSDEELTDLVTNGIKNAVERVLINRGHAPLSSAEREHMKQD